MKISTETQQILKNFASINQGILLTPGNVICTRTSAVLGEATVAETFPMEVGIYDLNNFLNVIGLFDDPEFEFNETHLVISESNGKADTVYGYAGGGLVTLPHPRKMKPLPEDVIKFTLTEEQWTKLQKSTSIFQKLELKIVSDGKTVRMSTANHKQDSGNSFSMVLDAEPNGLKCNMVFSKENLNLLKGSYEGVITPSYTLFQNTSGFNLKYYIAVEPTSSSFGN